VCSDERAQCSAAYDPASAPPRKPRSPGSWADLVRRAFGYDLLTCPRCAGKMVLLAFILDRDAMPGALSVIARRRPPERDRTGALTVGDRRPTVRSAPNRGHPCESARFPRAQAPRALA
jgi:hypothetical protein